MMAPTTSGPSENENHAYVFHAENSKIMIVADQHYGRNSLSLESKRHATALSHALLESALNQAAPREGGRGRRNVARGAASSQSEAMAKQLRDTILAEWYYMSPLPLADAKAAAAMRYSKRSDNDEVSRAPSPTASLLPKQRLCVPIPKSTTVAINLGHNSRYQWMLQAARAGSVVLSPSRASLFAVEFANDSSGRLTMKTRCDGGGAVAAPSASTKFHYLQSSTGSLHVSSEVYAEHEPSNDRSLFYLYPPGKAAIDGGGYGCLKKLPHLPSSSATEKRRKNKGMDKDSKGDEWKLRLTSPGKEGLGQQALPADGVRRAPLDASTQPENEEERLLLGNIDPEDIGRLRIPVCIRSAGRRNQKGPFLSPIDDGRVRCDAKANAKPSTRDIFRLIYVGSSSSSSGGNNNNNNSDDNLDEKESGNGTRGGQQQQQHWFKIWTPSNGGRYLHVLTEKEVTPPRYYLSNKNGCSDSSSARVSHTPRRIYVSTPRATINLPVVTTSGEGGSMKEEKLFVKTQTPRPSRHVCLGTGADERFLWTIRERSDPRGAISLSIQSEITKQYLVATYRGLGGGSPPPYQRW
eukprot:jgi/Bigna1/67531/fgenesh1_pg.4_\